MNMYECFYFQFAMYYSLTYLSTYAHVYESVGKQLFKTAILFVGLMAMLINFEYFMWIIYISLALAVVSFFDYFWKFRKVVLNEK